MKLCSSKSEAIRFDFQQPLEVRLSSATSKSLDTSVYGADQ